MGTTTISRSTIVDDSAALAVSIEGVATIAAAC